MINTYFLPVFLTLLPQAWMVTHPGQKRKLRVAHASREFHPSEDLSELPQPGQEYQRWCCHRKTDRPRSAFWTVGPASHLTCRIHADSLHRWIFALPPMSLPILCLYKAHQRMYFSFWICTLQGSVQGFSESPEKVPSLLIQFQKYS
mgnify:CR=1 FL=1